MNNCDCGHPNCSQCSPMAGKTWRYRMGCGQYVQKDVGCIHEGKKAVEHTKKMIESYKKRLSFLEKTLKGLENDGQ